MTTDTVWAVEIDGYSDTTDVFCLARSKGVAAAIVDRLVANMYLGRRDRDAYAVRKYRIHQNAKEATSRFHHEWNVDLTLDDGTICGWNSVYAHITHLIPPDSQRDDPTAVNWLHHPRPYSQGVDMNNARDQLLALKKADNAVDVDHIPTLVAHKIVPAGWDQRYGTLRVYGTDAADVENTFRGWLHGLRNNPELRNIEHSSGGWRGEG